LLTARNLAVELSSKQRKERRGDNDKPDLEKTDDFSGRPCGRKWPIRTTYLRRALHRLRPQTNSIKIKSNLWICGVDPLGFEPKTKD